MRAKRIAILDWATMAYNQDELSPKRFAHLAEKVDVYPATKPEDTVSHIGDADVVICNKVLLTREVLEQVGLKERAKNFPAQLSGGEQQRVAIARALAKNPKLLLCDEPTGALDYHTGKAILKLLQDTSRRLGMTVIIITHNKALCDMADRVIRVKSGTVRSVSVNPHATPIEEIEW